MRRIVDVLAAGRGIGDAPDATAPRRGPQRPPARAAAASLRCDAMTAPSVTVTRHDSALGRWEMVRRAAPEALRPHVLGYLGYDEWTAPGFRRLEVPSAEVHVILSFGPAVRAPATVRSFVAAPHTRHTIVESDGEQHGVEIRLTPIGTHMLLGLPLHELADCVVAIEDVLGRAGAELPERLHAARTWPARFALLDRVLAARLDAARAPAAGVEHTWWRLVGTNGGATVEALAEEVGWSRRHLLGRFREHTGLPPKTFARILRFQRAARLLTDPGGPSLCEIALDCGYYDQAHLNRDFRAFAGRTPTELMAARIPDGGGYAGDSG
jgi:AraC-like DNA-binding protein